MICRYDVLLTANHPSRTYFITVASQYRPGAPNGYGFLQYSNASAGGLPPTPTVQENATLPWNQSQIDKARSVAASWMLPSSVRLRSPNIAGCCSTGCAISSCLAPGACWLT